MSPIVSISKKNLPQKYVSIWPISPPPPFLELLFKNNTKNAIEVITQTLLKSMKSTNIRSLQSSHYNTVKLGDKELLGHPKIVPYLYEVNWQLVMENGSLTPICSLSKRSLLPSLTLL